jgi:2-polyprenyl-6-hydroxyphenyl methylase / 3-demethylubiquinone-9 3-methyltransferase
MRSKNIDQAEIAKFDAISADWWNLDGEFKPLHDLNPIRLKFITDRIPITNKTVVDIGCGGGILAEGLAQQGAQVTGIDMSPKALSAAKLHLQTSQLDIDYQLMTAE